MTSSGDPLGPQSTVISSPQSISGRHREGDNGVGEENMRTSHDIPGEEDDLKSVSGSSGIAGEEMRTSESPREEPEEEDDITPISGSNSINAEEMKTSGSPCEGPGEEDDSKSVSGSSDNDNERVREKLKKTSIANVRPESSVAGDSQREGGGDGIAKGATDSQAVSESDLDMGDDDGKEKPRWRTRKRSIGETDSGEDIATGAGPGGKETTSTHRVHERKRSREISEEDMAKAARALNRVKTPPTHPEEDEIMGHGEEVNTTSSVIASPRKLERKRSRDRVDDGEKDEEADRKKKMAGERKEENEVEANTSASTSTKGLTNGKVFESPDVSSAESDIQSKTLTPVSGGFGNTSSASPFATASAGSRPLFGGSKSSDLFRNSSFGAMSGSAASPFASLGSASRPSSPFGTLGTASNKSSGFANFTYAPSRFGSLAGKSGDVISSAPKLSGPIGGGTPTLKPFGTPGEEDVDGGGDDRGGGDSEEKKENLSPDDKKEVFTEQEIATGEEGEITVFKCPGKIFYFDKENKAWKERGRGMFKLNKSSPVTTNANAFGLENPAPIAGQKKSARMIMRTDGTYTVILNVAIYKELKLGGDIGGNVPTSNTVQFSVPAPGGSLDLMILKLKSASHAKELHKHVKSLQEELFSSTA